MENMFATIKLGRSFEPKFQKYIIKEILKKIKSKAPKIQDTIRDRIRKSVRESLISTPEYRSILQGKLRAELGIPESDARIITVIDTWVNNIVVKTKTGKNPFLSIEIGIIKDDYSDVLSLPSSQYTYRSKHSQGEIPWLRWLLLEGDKRIVNKYEFSNDRESRSRSRSGMGVMVSKERGFWKVPSEFSGTSVNNFATRALGNIESVIDNIVQKVVKDNLR